MEKEENQKSTFMDNNTDNVKKTENFDENLETQNKNKQEKDQPNKEEIKKPTPEEKIAELEDKITRTFAEMENQEEDLKKKKKMPLNMVVIFLQKKLLVLLITLIVLNKF